MLRDQTQDNHQRKTKDTEEDVYQGNGIYYTLVCTIIPLNAPPSSQPLLSLQLRPDPYLQSTSAMYVLVAILLEFIFIDKAYSMFNAQCSRS